MDKASIYFVDNVLVLIILGCLSLVISCVHTRISTHFRLHTFQSRFLSRWVESRFIHTIQPEVSFKSSCECDYRPLLKLLLQGSVLVCCTGRFWKWVASIVRPASHYAPTLLPEVFGFVWCSLSHNLIPKAMDNQPEKYSSMSSGDILQWPTPWLSSGCDILQWPTPVADRLPSGCDPSAAHPNKDTSSQFSVAPKCLLLFKGSIVQRKPLMIPPGTWCH